MLKEQIIKKLTEREHILARSGMYLGSSTLTESDEYILDGDKFIQTTMNYVPGLVKIFNELIDNSIDEYVRTNGKYATKINVSIDDKEFSVKDNGRGIPVKEVETPDGTLYQPELAWTHARAGSNFEDENSSTIGTNGVGSMIASVFSKTFIGISNDGLNKCTVRCENNNEKINTKISKPTGAQGTFVTIVPDVQRFGLEYITDEHIKMIEQRLYNLSVSYPNITFRLNSKRIKLNAKKFLSMFGENGTIVEEENFSIGVFHSDTDDFKQFSLMNGLTLNEGGTHVDYISNGLVKNIRDKIIKKYKTIKPSDVKRKLFIVTVMNNFKGPKYRTQTKEYLSNPNKDIINYFNGFDLNKFSDKVYKNKTIIDSIINYFKISEEFKKKQEMEKLSKTKKRVRSEKYIRAVGKNIALFIGEGQSATNALMPGLGRNNKAFYSLKGKPLNAYSSSQKKFSANKELTELYQIIKNEGFEKIIISSDADVDGDSIAGLIIAFFETYLKEELAAGMLYRINTPIGASIKNGKLIDWVYDLDKMHLLKGPEIKYFKGLGSWTPDQMSQVLEKDGLENMIVQFNKTENSLSSIDNWYSDKKADVRKSMILENTDFSIVKV